MAIYEGDQQQLNTAVVNGVHAQLSPAQLKTVQAAGFTTYQFTASYTFHWPILNGGPISYRKGVAYTLDPALKAALLAAGAPMVAS
jgi:hypothetical protein